MAPTEFEVMRREEDRHWWYRGLHALVAATLGRHAGGLAPLRLLDAGCGTGGGLQRWRGAIGSASCYGIDLSADAVRLCRLRGDRRVAQAAVEALPFQDHRFDVVVSLDVLSMSAVTELPALDEVRRVLRPGGILILNLPAFEQLRGEHDRAVETKRRYTRSEVNGMLQRSGLRVLRSTYWNTTLVPLVWLVRRFGSRSTTPRSDFRPLPRIVSRLLEQLLRIEGAIALRRGLPFGASILCVATRDS